MTTELLDRIHAPLGEAFGRLRTESDVEAHRLGPQIAARFEKDGFVSGIPVLDEAQLRLVRDRIDAVAQRLDEVADDLYEVETAWRDRPAEVVTHFLGAWRLDDVLHDLVFAPRVVVPLAQLLGVERLRFWHDQAFLKPAGHPGVVPWHQDYSYWTRVGPPVLITMNIMLDEATPENGCVQFVPGSHRWRLLPKTAFGGRMDQLFDHLSVEERATFRPVPAVLRAGEASIHHAMTVHGSFGNLTTRPRRAIVLNYMAADTVVMDGATPLLRPAAPLPRGAVVAGDLFPIVFDAPGLSRT